MSSRWQAHKMGLINFWYYDEQEFPFVKGRILLRGSNGSGKSVTMQSVVPLLLDGDLSPERLDPFGSRDRKMVNYLLEDDDPREERTGYLYLEFKREDSPTYCTVGMGIRARRGRPLEKWYFGLHDGRRIGVDFQLYKEVGEKITLSRKELENRIGEGGQVFARQADYMAYVNRQIFGFETPEQYREMIDLLIQLRTPKLSRDFKPTVINDILSDSLQPLSDEDLRPMTEAIDNMDNLQLNLETQRKAGEAARKILAVFDDYNRKRFLEKTQALTQCREAQKDTRKQLEQDRQEREKQLQARDEAGRARESLETEKTVREKQRDELRRNDAFALKQQVEATRKREKILEENLAGKEKQVANKMRLTAQLQEQTERLRKQAEQKKADQEDLLREMEEPAKTMGFEEHAFFAEDCRKWREEPLDTATHRVQLGKLRKDLQDGIQLLEQIRFFQGSLDQEQQKRDQVQKKADQQERAERSAQDTLAQEISDWKELLFAWNSRNRELQLTREVCTEFARQMENYSRDTDFAAMLQQVDQVRSVRFSRLEVERQELEKQRQELEIQQKALQQELREWEQQKEPEPEREEAVQRNRVRLARMGIPCRPLYQLIDFRPGMAPELADHLEEALLRMGILDALVVEEKDRERIMKPVEGHADRYLFRQGETVKHSLLDVLQPEIREDAFQERTRVLLGSIAWNTGSTMAVREDGSYRMGILEGTGSGQYQAGLIGAQARERNRQQKMAQIRSALGAIRENLAELEKEIRSRKDRQGLLEDEFRAFPRDRELQAALKNLEQIQQRLEQLRTERQGLDDRIRELNQAIRTMGGEAAEYARKLYLPCTYEAFRKAQDALNRYGEQLARLEGVHENWLQLLARVHDQESRREEGERDRQQLAGEQARIQLELEETGKTLEAMKEQLSYTDFAQIKAAYDACTQWLDGYSRNLTELIHRIDGCEAACRQLEEKVNQLQGQLEGLGAREAYLVSCWQEEAELRYVPECIRDDGTLLGPEETEKVLRSQGVTPGSDGLVHKLNEVFYQNREFLGEYSLYFQAVFERPAEENHPDWPSARRLDFSAQYCGVRIQLPRLSQLLDEKIRQLESLIQDKDRELFEDILSNTVGRKIRSRIYESRNWVENMNRLMGRMDTSSGLRLHLRWRARTAETEEEMDTADLVELLKKDYRVMKPEEARQLNAHFRSKVKQAHRRAKDSGGEVSFHQVMRETLDYRKWFEFQLFTQKGGEKLRELTNSVFGTFSGGEKAMSMYVPLFSAVVARYQAAREDAPRLIALDEAFAGVDRRNIRDMFKLMAEFQFNFIINSQVLWGDVDTLDALAIYELIRPNNVKFVSVMAYRWDGQVRYILKEAKENEAS
ncbi:MAG: TIGR02680 family protein [Acidaminococcus fermentans]|uniref:TIGR02680 family protein n=1 Tax=Acidaminococcus fermentans TaxID=905 RepID=UPI00242A3E49|nr:TIGR02680 family protein [Acidaminococcus fermentans]MCI7193884.1 TIGR02680 family protein [Acidaminococcus fermentans]